MTITIKDVAAKAGVSITTVSRVLNGKFDAVGKETRERVMQVIEELGYQPNHIARSMITKKTGTIGLLIPDITNPFFPEMARGVEDAANANKINTFLCNTDRSLEKENQIVSFLSQRSVDGFIVTTNNSIENNSIFENLHQKGVPVVFVERYLKRSCSIPSIYFKNELGAYLATKHLGDCGYKRLACITGPLNAVNARLRISGFRRACLEMGIELNAEWILEGNYEMESGYKAAKKLLQVSFDEVEGIFASNDLMAVGVIRAAKELGFKIPEDLGVIGFDDISISKIVDPSLTTVKIPGYKMGFKAAEMLVKLISGEKLDCQKVEFEPELIIRNSTLEKR